MKKFTIDKKTGFVITALPVIIYDDKGKIFYDTNNVNKKVRAFNMPIGDYVLNTGKIKSLDRPVSYVLFDLPIRQRIGRPKIDNFTIEVGDNPNKCSILWGEKKIIFDKNFIKNLTRSEINYIIYHERGHELYSKEEYADFYAANEMLKSGFNPSQIGLAILDTLSPKQIERKTFIINKLIKK